MIAVGAGPKDAGMTQTDRTTDALRAKILVGIADSLGAGLVRELAEVRDRKLVEVLKISRT